MCSAYFGCSVSSKVSTLYWYPVHSWVGNSSLTVFWGTQEDCEKSGFKCTVKINTEKVKGRHMVQSQSKL